VAERGPQLDTIGAVVRELGKVYREARRKEITTQDAARFASILSTIRAAIEGSELERRIERLEHERRGQGH
jgi:hypothetical protein